MFKVFTTLTRKQATWLVIWALALLVVGVGGGGRLIQLEKKNLQDSIKKHSDRMDPIKTEDGKTQAEMYPPPNHEKDIPREVLVGIYVDRIPALSFKDFTWTADFYIWFKWQGNDLKPGDTFQIVNGDMNKPDLVKEDIQGDTHYALYRVTAAKITKAFNTSRFPRDDHLLTIAIEDKKLQSYQLKYIADTDNSAVSSRVIVSGYQIYKVGSVVKPHSYKTTRGDFGLPPDYKATYSQFNYGIWLQRPSWGLHIRMFLTMFAAVIIPMIGFFTTPTHRLTVVVGAFFAAVATTYVTSTAVPDTGIATMADVINGVGIVTIAIIIFQTIISQYIYDKQKNENLSDAFDYITFVLLFGMFVWLNIAIPVAASLPTYAPIK